MENNNFFSMTNNGLKAIPVLLLLIALIAFVVAQTILTGWKINEINTPYSQQITVKGEGTATVSPDTASLSFGIETTADTVGEAQEKNTEIVNTVLDDIRNLGIGDEDIETSSYNVYEDQVWNPETREYETKGWVVSQWIDLTIRDVSIAPDVVVLAGKHDVTNVSSLEFYKDDVTEVKQEARDEAIAAAKRQAEAIAKSLNVEIHAVVDYYEQSSDVGNYNYGYGREVYAENASAVPELEPGSDNIIISVSVTYELR